MKHLQKNFRLRFLLGILGLVVIVGGAYWYVQSHHETQPGNSNPSIVLTKPAEGATVPFDGNLKISWQVTDVPADAKVQFYLNEPSDFYASGDVGPIDPVGYANAKDGNYMWHVDMRDCTGSGCSTIEYGKPYTLTVVVGKPQDTSDCLTHCGNWFDVIASTTSDSFFIMHKI